MAEENSSVAFSAYRKLEQSVYTYSPLLIANSEISLENWLANDFKNVNTQNFFTVLHVSLATTSDTISTHICHPVFLQDEMYPHNRPIMASGHFNQSAYGNLLLIQKTETVSSEGNPAKAKELVEVIEEYPTMPVNTALRRLQIPGYSKCDHLKFKVTQQKERLRVLNPATLASFGYSFDLNY
ncbi:hypothetical protein [Gimesia alba]|nr:hypothetical protein [Gimesia alba]